MKNLKDEQISIDVQNTTRRQTGQDPITTVMSLSVPTAVSSHQDAVLTLCVISQVGILRLLRVLGQHAEGVTEQMSDALAQVRCVTCTISAASFSVSALPAVVCRTSSHYIIFHVCQHCRIVMIMIIFGR